MRFDQGTIRPAQITPEGYLCAEAIFCRDGILEYRTHTGKVRRELRLPEVNQAALTGFGLKPYTTEHPPILLDASNAKQYAQGLTDSTVYYDPKAGFVRGVITVFDSNAIASITQGKTVEISAGYQCNVKEEPGAWRGERYDAIQESIYPNHIAGTAKGRAGPNVRFLNLFDSCATAYKDVAYEDSGAAEITYFDLSNSKKRKNTKKNMATITRNGLTFEDVPGDLAGFVGQELNRLDSVVQDSQLRISQLEESARQDAETIQYLNNQISEKSSENAQLTGRAEEFEILLTNAESILTDMGFRKDSSGNYYRTDKKAKKPSKAEMMPDEDEDDDDDPEEGDPEEEASETPEEEEQEEEEKPALAAKKKKTKKSDSISDRLKAWKSAEKVVPGLMDSEHFDAELDVGQINSIKIDAMKSAILAAQPNYKLENRTDSYIEGVYEGLVENSTTRVDHTGNLDVLLGAAARNGGVSPLEAARKEIAQKLSDAWKSPLSMSTRK